MLPPEVLAGCLTRSLAVQVLRAAGILDASADAAPALEAVDQYEDDTRGNYDAHHRW